MEEEEARKIHQRMMSELENVDLNNELFMVIKDLFKTILSVNYKYYVSFMHLGYESNRKC